ncbi:MAG: response regulator transcription factor [Anaerolineae bacterium]|nr:response regulator transcription factor [Anaerolineae bacterium]MCO5193093.1 response regulator transcription factor [Anaerolineae bacterium]
MSRIRVVAVEDHELMLLSLSNIINADPELEMVALGRVGEEALPLVKKYHPDILLLDQRMPQYADPSRKERFRPIPTIRMIRRICPTVRIVIHSAWADPGIVRQALAAGVNGFISKEDSQQDITQALKLVMKNSVYLSEAANSAYVRQNAVGLTQRQIEVLAAINQNPTAEYSELADDLGVSLHTFKKHLSLALARLETPNNKLAGIKYAERLGLL